jgi:PAS domain S-box-containing protein
MAHIQISSQRWLRPIATLLVVAAAAWLRLEFLPALGLRHPFLTFYPAVVIAALYGGLYCGFLASAFSALLADFYLTKPAGVLFSEDALSVAVFIFEGVMVSCITEVMRRSQARAREAEAHAKISEAEKRSAETLRESEERLRLALESGQMGMWEWDLRSDCSVWNNKEYQLLGLPPGDGNVATREFFRCVHPDDRAAFDMAVAEVMAGGTDFSTEFRIVRPDGEVRWLAAKGRLFRDDSGQPSRMMGVNFDITANRLADQELQRSEAEARARAEELEVLMDTVPAITFIAHDPECRTMSGSLKSRQLLRVPEGKSVSKSAPEEVRPDTFRALKNGVELRPEELPLQRAARGEEIRDWEMTLLYTDGTSCDICGNAVPLFDESGKVRGAIGAFLDITERKKIQRDLQKARDELEQRVAERTAELRQAMEALKKETEERMETLEALRERDQLLMHQSRLAVMGEMINNIAHQWRQPLNLMGLIVQELPMVFERGEFTKEYLSAQKDKAIGLILHMSQTIEDFRNFFRPSRVKVEFKAHEMIAKTLALVEDALKEWQIKVEVSEVGDPVIYGYLSECCQVVLNVLQNSRDAFVERREEKPRQIRVTTCCEDGRTVVTIADNAGGIPEEIIGQIFEPYFTTKGPDKGTGIGLYMAKNIIEKHMNGAFTVRNIDGGAEFRIVVDSKAPDGNS